MTIRTHSARMPRPAPAKPRAHTYSTTEMLQILRRMAAPDGTLSRPTYIKRRGNHQPTAHLFELRFGTWNRALVTAGLTVTPQPEQFIGVGVRWTRQQMIKAIDDCAHATGSTSLRAYEAWRTDAQHPQKNAPPAATIRARMGSWSLVTLMACHPRTHIV